MSLCAFEYLVAFTAIFSNICTAHAQKRLCMNFRCKCRHRRSIRRPRFPIRVQNVSDLATFSIDFFLHFICWMSAIFLLPVCLTYWPRKYTTCVDPDVDNSHQVWSWYDHTAPWTSSAFLCRRHWDLRVLRPLGCWRIARASVGLHWWSFLLDDAQPVAA